MSDHEDIDSRIANALASESKKVYKKSNLVHEVQVQKLPEVKRTVQKMREDGFSPAQIAAALGFEENKIAFLLEDRPDLGTPEQILQDSLRTLVSLIPIADATYRDRPSHQHAQAVTGMIDSCKGVISELYQLKDKEEIYRTIMQKVVQPIIRGMISDMMVEFRFLDKSIIDSPEKGAEHIQNTAVAIGKKFDEAYRRSTELLANIIGLNADAKARALAALALNNE